MGRFRPDHLAGIRYQFNCRGFRGRVAFGRFNSRVQFTEEKSCIWEHGMQYRVQVQKEGREDDAVIRNPRPFICPTVESAESPSSWGISCCGRSDSLDRDLGVECNCRVFAPALFSGIGGHYSGYRCKRFDNRRYHNPVRGVCNLYFSRDVGPCTCCPCCLCGIIFLSFAWQKATKSLMTLFPTHDFGVADYQLCLIRHETFFVQLLMSCIVKQW